MSPKRKAFENDNLQDREKADKVPKRDEPGLEDFLRERNGKASQKRANGETSSGRSGESEYSSAAAKPSILRKLSRNYEPQQSQTAISQQSDGDNKAQRSEKDGLDAKVKQDRPVEPEGRHNQASDFTPQSRRQSSNTSGSRAFKVGTMELPAPYNTRAVRELFEKHPAQALANDFSNGAGHHSSADALSSRHRDLSLPPLPPLAEGPYADAVFTHSSVTDSKYTATTGSTSILDYERLEFLGDAYIEVFAVKLIFARFGHLDIGKQNRLREELARNKTLAEFARRYDLRSQLRHEKTMSMATGEAAWTKILADVFEAYVAAIVLSDPINGFATADAWLTALWAPVILEIEDGRSDVDLKGQQTNFKEVLQSHIGGAKGVKIEYRDLGPMGYTKDKALQVFTVGCYVTGWGFTDEEVGVGKGQNKREAGVAAAKVAVQRSRSVDTMRHSKQLDTAERKRKREEEEARNNATVGSTRSRPETDR